MTTRKLPGISKWRTFAAGTYCQEGKHSYQEPGTRTTSSHDGFWVRPRCRGANRKPAGYDLTLNGTHKGHFSTPQAAIKHARSLAASGLGRARRRR